MNPRLSGLYLITPALPERSQDDASYLQSVADAISGGARLLQFRDKSTDQKRRRAVAFSLRKLCQASATTFIINDDVDLALAVDADGVHLGQQDCSLLSARQRMGDQAIIGVSCYNRLELAQAAERQGADYVAFGRFFHSQNKPDAAPAPIPLLTMAKQSLYCPVVAIGGITTDNARQLIEAGADMLAVIDGVFGQQDRQGAARAIAKGFSLDAD